MIDTGQLVIQQGLEQTIQAIGVGRRPDFVVVQCRRLILFESRLDPIDSTCVAAEANTHGQRDPQDTDVRIGELQKILRGSHGLAVDGNWIR